MLPEDFDKIADICEAHTVADFRNRKVCLGKQSGRLFHAISTDIFYGGSACNGHKELSSPIYRRSASSFM